MSEENGIPFNTQQNQKGNTDMKWMIVSDLHGSDYYCDCMLRAFSEEKAGRILSLGDLLYHGPRNDLPKDYAPKRVIEKLNSLKEVIFNVRGNCEADVDQMVLEFPVLSDYAILDIDGVNIFATHGHIYHPQSLPPLPKGSVFLYGHTHIPKKEEVNGILCFNPGSMSIPKMDSWHGYMIFEERTFIWKDFDGKERMRIEV